MRKVWVIARHEYLVNVRRKGFLLITLLVPAVGALLLGVAVFFGGEARQVLENTFADFKKPVGIVDQVGLFESLSPAEARQFHVYGTQAEGEAALRGDEVAILLVVPDDYMDTGNVTVYSLGTGFAAATLQDSTALRALFVAHILPTDTNAAVRRRAADPIHPEFIDLGHAAAPGSGSDLSMVANLILPYVLSILLVTTIFVSSGYLLRSVAEEKTSRVIEVMLSSVTARQLLGGKVMGLGALGLTQVGVWIVSAVALSGGMVAFLGVAVPLLSRPDVIVLSIVYYALGFLLYAVLMGSVGALGTTMQESQQLAGIFSLFAAIPLMLSGIFFQDPNIAIARALSWFPLTAPTTMLTRIGLGRVPLVDIVGSITVLLVTIPLVLWAGAKVFRMGLLMYGKRPDLRQVLKALREA